MSHRRGVLSLVEHGWRSARELALAAAARGVPVVHVVRGRLTPKILAVIGPRPWERFISVPRRLYRIGQWGVVCSAALGRRIRWLVVDNERTLAQLAPWCWLFRWTMILAEEVDNRCVYRIAGRERPLEEIFRLTSSLPVRSTSPGKGSGGSGSARSGGC
ncbi:MAG: hypothetical protein HY598_03415 [Candidatus Omnitrophica bacterium]|nr:hypothetical protein [Candidatus Omnitrophota bacterium]